MRGWQVSWPGIVRLARLGSVCFLETIRLGGGLACLAATCRCLLATLLITSLLGSESVQ